MNEQLKTRLKQYHENFDDFQEYVQIVEHSLEKNGFLMVAEENEVFWNHVLSLLRRMLNNEQNVMEVDFEIEEYYLNQSRELKEILNQKMQKEMTDFEAILLAIYFQKFAEEVDNNE